MCKTYDKINSKYVRFMLISRQNMYEWCQVRLNLCKIYAKFNAIYVRSTLKSMQNI